MSGGGGCCGRRRRRRGLKEAPPGPFLDREEKAVAEVVRGRVAGGSAVTAAAAERGRRVEESPRRRRLIRRGPRGRWAELKGAAAPGSRGRGRPPMHPISDEFVVHIETLIFCLCS